MKRKIWLALVVCTLAVAIACSRQSGNPGSPSASAPGRLGSSPDGTTLKASAPIAQAPLNGLRLEPTTQPTLVVQNSVMQYGSSPGVQYRFEVFNAAGARVYQSPLVNEASGGTTSHTVSAELQADQTYSWWARAELSQTFTGWSNRANATFVAPASTGYIRGNELYDPLINGQTVGELHGAVQLIPGLGLKILSQEGFVSYELPTPLNEGEFSLIVTNLASNTEGGKTKLFAMADGYGDIVTNEYRMTVEKRGDPPGTVAWRFIARDDQVDTEGAEREIVDFFASQTYFWEATWRSNFFNVRILEGGAPGVGHEIYEKGKHWEGRGYEPKRHVLYLGAPIGRSGADGASVNDVIIRQVWVSSRPRPAFANK
jgi:hypothetical protein